MRIAPALVFAALVTAHEEGALGRWQVSSLDSPQWSEWAAVVLLLSPISAADILSERIKDLGTKG